jgi:transposase-like protein
MMTKKELDFNEILSYLEKLPYSRFKEVVYHYASHTNNNFKNELEDMITLNFQQRLQKLSVNSCCPKCNSGNIVKNGKKKLIQQYKCNECNSRFTLFTGTILEKTKWHWDIWIAVLNMTINSFSLKEMKNVLEKDYACIGINHKTLFLLKHKLIHTLASLPMPKLSGVVQVDETFIRESQKGSRSLISYLGKDEEREPRYGRKPSKYGVMGSEFATVTTAIDNRGYSVCKVSCLGKLTIELFITLFEEHLLDPSYICSDANSVYEGYCKSFNVAHYIRPSNYLTVIDHNGYATPSYSNPSQAKITKEKNKQILESLYKNNMIDYISNRGVMTYDELAQLKTFNRLSLSRVNELHADIKNYIYGHMTNVSTKYLQDYLGFFTYIRNWRVANGNYPSSMKDTEKIFIEILKVRAKYTVDDIKEKQLVLPKPSTRYITILKTETEKIRTATNNKYFKFDEEDGVKSFNKREYLLDQPKSKLYGICKAHIIKKYRKLALYSLVSLILKLPDIDNIIYELIISDRHYKIANEDLEAIKSNAFKNYY